MKKALLSLAIIFSAYCSYAQWTNISGTNNINNTNTGNVGIGTSNPQAPLDVAGLQIHLADPSASPFANYSYLKTSAATYNTQALSIGTTYGYNTPVDALTIFNGKVGIGAVTPSVAALQIAAPDQASLSAIAIRQSNSYGYGFDFALDQLVDGKGYLYGIAGNARTALIQLDRTNNTIAFPAGKISIGTTDATAFLTPGGANTHLTLQSIGADGAIRFYTIGGSTNNAAPTESMRIAPGGNVLIGKVSENPGVNYKLDVAGSVRANSIVVNTTGADFVFDKNYVLPNLSAVKSYIDQNHHLPEISSAEDMKKNGMDVGNLNTKLLQKVEELTLYLIDKDKQLSEQNSKIAEQQKQIDFLKQQQMQINELKQQMQVLLKAAKN